MAGLNPNKVVMFTAYEQQFGADAIEGATGAELDAMAVPVLNPRFTPETNLIDRNVARGSKGQSLKAVGRSTSAFAFDMELVGSSDPTNTLPPWARLIRSAGVQTEPGTLLNVQHAVGAMFTFGEFVYGAVTTPTQWKATEVGTGGANVADPTAAEEKECVLYPPGESPTSDMAVTGKLVTVVNADVVLIRLDEGVTAQPKANWHVRVDENAGVGTDYRYNQLSLDMPVGIVLAPRENEPENGLTLLHVWTSQGAWLNLPGKNTVVGQRSGAAAVITAPASAYGTVVRPDSEEQIEFTIDGDWSGSDPAPGDSILAQTDPSNSVGGGLVLAYDAGTKTVTVQDFWGGFAAGAKVVVQSSGSEATVDSNGAVQTRTPSRTSHLVIDSRRHRGVGLRDNFTLAAEAGQPALLSFESRGTSGADPDSVVPPEVDISVEIPPRWESGFASFDGILLRTSQMQFQSGNNLAEVADANSPDGVAGYALTSRDPTLTFTVETAGTIRGAGDWEARMKAGETVPIGFAWTSTDKRVALVVPQPQIESAAPSGDDVLQHALTTKCREPIKDADWLMLVY